MKLKPWHNLVVPREDLREGRPLDASEFAVHLDQVRDKRAPDVYQQPKLFFERTFPTKNLRGMAAEVIRRLSGEKTETSAVFNMATQFGGGKTHALTLLYHLARHGNEATTWFGVPSILSDSRMASIPKAACAVFVGTEFDSITGRGGDDGTPVRKTPWGEIAYQLGGADSLAVLEQHEKQLTAPAGDVIRKFLPDDKPCLILMDELMNYVSRTRKSGLATQLYNFVQNLSEEARARRDTVLAVSIPASELEMSAEDQADYDRFKKMLDRLGKAVIMSSEAETSEIIRRRLFDWGGVPDEAKKIIGHYADWIEDHRQQLPDWFPIDNARDALAATYPFHPTVISVFERKWQALPRFQRTRGVLRLLALWVSRAYADSYRKAHRDPLIGLGTAPLDDPMFRSALFEQLGENRLEGAVTTDICGRTDSHSIRLDKEAVDTIKKARLHKKVATAIFFESNGGTTRAHATVPEIRMDVSEPDLDIGNVETAISALADSCYFLIAEGTKYRFDLKPNLNKLLSDKRAIVQKPQIRECVRKEVQKAFAKGSGVERIFFPEKSSQVPDRPVLTLAVLAPESSMQDQGNTFQSIDVMTKEYGSSARTFKSALIWCVTESPDVLDESARKVLAWEAIEDEQDDLGLDDGQKRQLTVNLKKAQRDLEESVWRSYKNLVLLNKDNTLRKIDLGLIHSSSANSMLELILERLKQNDDVVPGISPNFLVRNWPPAFKEWSTKNVKNAFFASPQFPRLLYPEAVKETIAKGVSSGILGYVGKTETGAYEPFRFNEALSAEGIEISDDMFIITAEEAKKHLKPPVLTSIVITPSQVTLKPGKKQTFTFRGLDQHSNEFPVKNFQWSATGGSIEANGVFTAHEGEGSFIVTLEAEGSKKTANVAITKREETPPPPPPEEGGMSWHGEVPAQKWMNFYTKVLAKFASTPCLKLTIGVEVPAESRVTESQIEETKTALKELGLSNDVKSS